jgi:hypothetical protein
VRAEDLTLFAAVRESLSHRQYMPMARWGLPLTRMISVAYGIPADSSSASGRLALEAEYHFSDKEGFFP